MFKSIIGIGDSWIYGDELLDPAVLPTTHYSVRSNIAYRESNCFIGLLGKHYSVPSINLGIPGGSLQSTVWSFLQWLDATLKPEEYLILIGLTESDRISHYDSTSDKLIHSTWHEDPASKFYELFKQQIANTSSDKSRKLNYQQTVLTLDGIAARRNLNLIQFNIADPPVILDVPTLVNPEHSLTKWFTNELQVVHGRKYIKDKGHPNEIGHELVSKYLISYIDSYIM